MAWFWRGIGGWIGPWPGRGPFSYLPPWERPGWIFGRGWCWWFLRWWTYPLYAFYSRGFWHPYWIPSY